MAEPGAHQKPGRNQVRKAATRQRITRAANQLFLDRGYVGTSMDDIATSAEVAIRTLYLHFDSKAAILLAYFDEWLDEFVHHLSERSLGERLDDVLARALGTMRASGRWDDDKRIEDVTVLHPVVEFIGGGSPEIAGHIMQRWVQAQDRLTEAFRVTAGLPLGAAEPRIDAAAVFAAWMTSVLDFRSRFTDGVSGASTHDVGGLAMRAYVDGLGPTRVAPTN